MFNKPFYDSSTKRQIRSPGKAEIRQLIELIVKADGTWAIAARGI
jgi:hypothetical protein